MSKEQTKKELQEEITRLRGRILDLDKKIKEDERDLRAQWERLRLAVHGPIPDWEARRFPHDDRLGQKESLEELVDQVLPMVDRGREIQVVEKEREELSQQLANCRSQFKFAIDALRNLGMLLPLLDNDPLNGGCDPEELF